MSTDKSVWPSLVGRRVRMVVVDGDTLTMEGTLEQHATYGHYRVMPGYPGMWWNKGTIGSITPLEEPFVPGMWFEQNSGTIELNPGGALTPPE